MRTLLAVLASTLIVGLAVPAFAQGASDCPPGLAKKGCVPRTRLATTCCRKQLRALSFLKALPMARRSNG